MPQCSSKQWKCVFTYGNVGSKGFRAFKHISRAYFKWNDRYAHSKLYLDWPYTGIRKCISQLFLLCRKLCCQKVNRACRYGTWQYWLIRWQNRRPCLQSGYNICKGAKIGYYWGNEQRCTCYYRWSRYW